MRIRLSFPQCVAVLAALCLLLTVAPLPASAQEDGAGEDGFHTAPSVRTPESSEGKTAQQAAKIYRQLPREDQERLVEEAHVLYNQCMERPVFSDLYDCRCIAAEAMDARILNPDRRSDIVAIGDEVAGKCPDAAGAAGYAYKNCISLYENVMPYGLEDYCTCFGNNFSKIYMQDPRAYMPHIQSVNVAATNACEKEGIMTPLQAMPK